MQVVLLMSNLKFKKKCYHAKVLGEQIAIQEEQGVEIELGYKVPIYDKPTVMYLSYQPIKDKYYQDNFGEYARQTVKIIVEKDKYKGVFKEKDRFYLNGYSPNGESVYGEFANYEIESVRYQRLYITIYCKRISGKDSLRLGVMEMTPNFQSEDE